ncbi:MAG: patatin [Rhodobiaceae bacterium]|nr:MAG: patatin [Rhodobiaceae bacterium]
MSSLKNAQQMMDDATSYQEWQEAACDHDALSGADEWKKREHSDRYDYATIRERLREIRKARRAGDDRALLFALNEGIHGNLGGMGKASLYTRSKFGTKRLITDYVEEVTEALDHIAKVRSNVITKAEKKDFFHRASHCFGRSALMLSGAGALGPFHIGVIKTLLEEDLLPRVISGSSAGALIAAIVGTHSDEELKPFFDADVGIEAPIEQMGLTSVLGWRDRIQTEDLREMVEAWIPDVTFAEAFQMTGRHINISVAPFRKMQASRLLNAITSPNVLLRDAIMASCAVPGVFPPVMLMARDADGEKQPYLSDMRWIDGSVTDDLPAKRLGRLYGVNHFIASQTNPIILWTIRNPNGDGGLFANLWDMGSRASKEWFRATRNFADRATRAFPNANSAVNMFHSVALQEYTADINIIPRYRFWDPRKLLAPLDQEEMRYLIDEGEAAAWPQVEMIRNCSIISHTLDAILEDIEGDVVGLYRPNSTRAMPQIVANG